MSEPQKPEGLTDREWAAILHHRALQAGLKRYEQAVYSQQSKAFDADREAFTRFARALGFVRQPDARLHADFSSFRSDVLRAE